MHRVPVAALRRTLTPFAPAPAVHFQPERPSDDLRPAIDDVFAAVEHE
jgi:hypothetical protein